MQQSVGFIQSWPGAVIKQLYLDEYQVIFIFMAILSLYLWAVASFRKGPHLILSALVAVFILSGLTRIEKTAQVQAVVYHIAGHTAIDLLCNSTSTFICDSALSASPAKISFNVLPNRELQGVDEVTEIHLDEIPLHQPDHSWLSYPFVYFMGRKIVIIDDTWRMRENDVKLPFDLAVITGKKGPSLQEVTQSVDVKCFIIDGSVPRYRADRLVKEAVEINLPCHSTWISGGYVQQW